MTKSITRGEQQGYHLEGHKNGSYCCCHSQPSAAIQEEDPGTYASVHDPSRDACIKQRTTPIDLMGLLRACPDMQSLLVHRLVNRGTPVG